MATKRLKFLDISKGIGMMMIVWMHVWGNKPFGFTPPELLNNLISSIYVPLFFVLSGYLVKPDTFGFRQEILKKTKSLLRPFAVMYLVSFLASFALHLVGFEAKHAFAWGNLLNVVYSDTFFNGPLWFLLALFWAFLLFYAAVLACRRNIIASALLTLALGCFGFHMDRLGIKLPLFMGPAFVACPLLMVGCLTRLYVCKLMEGKWRKLAFALAGILLLICFKCSLSMQDNVYIGHYPLFIVSVFGGSVAILGLSMLTERWFGAAEYWGKYSLVVLCFHNFVLIPVGKVFASFIHEPVAWAIATFVVVYLAFLAIIPLAKRFCPSLFNIKTEKNNV